jgi:hypothetical protein
MVRNLNKEEVVWGLNKYLGKDWFTGVLRQNHLMGSEWRDQLVQDLSKNQQY